MLTSSRQGLLQNQSLETVPVCFVVLCNITCVMNGRDQTTKRLSHAFVHIVTARASLFTDHNIAGLPIRAKCRHFQKNVWANCGQLSNWSNFFLFTLMVIYAWRRDFVKLLRRFIRQFAKSFHAFLGMTFHVIGPWRYRFGIRFLHGFCFWQFSIAPAEFLDSNIFLSLSTIYLLVWHSRWVQPK